MGPGSGRADHEPGPPVTGAGPPGVPIALVGGGLELCFELHVNRGRAGYGGRRPLQVFLKLMGC